MRQNRTDADNLHFFHEYRGPGFCITGACFWEILTERFDLTRLTGLAGTTCDNRNDRQWISGAWYDPERSGEGFVVEVIPDGRGVVYWFTHQPDDSGRQAWMMGVGEFEGNTLLVDGLIQPVGTVFGPDFDPGDVQRTVWGSLEMEFIDDSSGHVSWNSVFDDYGSGEHPLNRLARPQLADCTGD